MQDPLAAHIYNQAIEDALRVTDDRGATAALNEMLADVWESAYYSGRMADNDWDYENPYRKEK